MTNEERERLAVLEERVARVTEFHMAEINMTRKMLEYQDGRMTTEFEAAEKAITKAENATEKRFEGVNEFRSALSDQAARFVTRDLHDSLQDAHNKDVRDLRDLIDVIRSAQSRTIGIAVGVSSTITIFGVLGSIIIRLLVGG